MKRKKKVFASKNRQQTSTSPPKSTVNPFAQIVQKSQPLQPQTQQIANPFQKIVSQQQQQQPLQFQQQQQQASSFFNTSNQQQPQAASFFNINNQQQAAPYFHSNEQQQPQSSNFFQHSTTVFK